MEQIIPEVGTAMMRCPTFIDEARAATVRLIRYTYQTPLPFLTIPRQPHNDLRKEGGNESRDLEGPRR
jgi:hypothetical protein